MCICGERWDHVSQELDFGEVVWVRVPGLLVWGCVVMLVMTAWWSLRAKSLEPWMGWVSERLCLEQVMYVGVVGVVLLRWHVLSDGAHPI